MDKILIKETLKSLTELKNYIEKDKIKVSKEIKDRDSYLNLHQYLKLRNFDLTKLQDNLASLGLSSLGASQSNIIYTVNQEIEILSKLLNQKSSNSKNDNDYISYFQAQKKMFKNSEIFGKVLKSDIFKTKVMITLPSNASDNPDMIKEFAKSGANIFRINTAHDSAEAWDKMAKTIKEINEKRDRDNQVKIYVDLAGPKIRTGYIRKTKAAIKIGSKKEQEKRVILSFNDDSITKQESVDLNGTITPAVISVDKNFIKKCKKGEYIELTDLNDKKRYLEVVDILKDSCECIIRKKAIIDGNSTLSITYKDKDRKKITVLPRNIEEVPEEIRVFIDDEIIITNRDMLGYTNHEYAGKLYKAIISCSNKEALEFVKKGDEVFIDDGKIGLVVAEKSKKELICKVTYAKDNGSIIKEEKGINFPNSKLNLDAITNEDRKNLKAVVKFADILGVSFAQSGKDIFDLKLELKKLTERDISIVAKIETKLAVKNLPDILSSLLTCSNSGIMIARGDLAIEVGFQKLAYIQEEIFDLCASAHMPVIYATQILENKMKKNLPSRAEITDAAFGQRADCIMLNKGAFATDTIKILKDILRDMHKIFKKNKQLLNISEQWKK